MIMLPFSALTAGRITDNIKNHLIETFNFDPRMTEISCRPELDTINVSDTTEIAVSCREYPIPSGYFPLKILLQEGSGSIRAISTSVDISFYENVLVSKTRIKSRDAVSRSDFDIERVKVNDIVGNPLMDYAQIKGMRASKTISRGKVVTEEMIEPIPIIKRGERIKLVYESANLRIETYGIAKSDAVEGEIVEVKNSASGKRISGRAVAPGIIFVER